MSKVRVWLVLSLAICLMFVSAVRIFAESPADKPGISIRKVDEQVVLYTIHRGSYDKIGSAIGNLFALAGKKGIAPRGSIYYVYLNNPNRVSSQHWLTEVRISVSKEALKAAGTLGEMTDIKTVPATEVAVAVKPEGQADPSGIYNRLYAWTFKQGYITTDSAREIFLTNAMTGNYAQMETEIMIPVIKMQPREN